MDASAKKNPARTIFLSVCFIHCVFLAFILCKTPLLPAKKQHKPIAVKTITLAPQRTVQKKVTAAPSRSAPVQKSSAPAKKQAMKPPQAKKTSAPAEKKPIEKAKPAAAPDKQLAIPPSLLRELEESIAKIELKDENQKPVKKTARLSVPVTLQIDTPEYMQMTSIDEDYITTLTAKLHASLHLPDFGEVKIELTLNQDGTIAKLKVLKAESQQNRKYLESELPKVKFSKLSGSFAKQNAHTFTLTFCNES